MQRFNKLHRLINMKHLPLICGSLLLFSSTRLFSQENYVFASTGQQKLIINPALAATTKGLELQTLSGYHPGSSFLTNYTGVCYGLKGFAFGLSNTCTFNGDIYNYYYSYGDQISNKSDVSISYKIRLGKKVTLVPSVQASVIYRKFNNAVYPMWCGDFNYIAPYYPATRYNMSASSGILLDLNKVFTFGAAFYNLNQPDIGVLYPNRMGVTQMYHLSGLLFKNKKINLQPYAILKIDGMPNYNNYIEGGLYATYRILSLQLATRNGDQVITGASANYKGFRLGYTMNLHYYSYLYRGPLHEMYLSAGIFNKNKQPQRNLMLN
jgi:hypothetical protein